MVHAYLELADFLLMAEAVLGVLAETLVRSDRVVALAQSALAAPAASFDGNKRTANLCLIGFIERNGYVWLQPKDETVEDDVVETMVRLAAGQVSEAEFAEWIRSRVVSGHS